MRIRPLAVLSAAALGGCLLLPSLASGAPSGLPPAPTVAIVVTCVEATGGHLFETTVTNPAGGQNITLINDATLTIDAGPPGAIATPTNADFPMAPGATAEMQDILNLTSEAGTVVFNGHYTREGIQGQPFTLIFTATFEACTPPPPPPPPPPPDVDDEAEPVPAAPNFTG